MATDIFENVSAVYENAIENYKKFGKTCLQVADQLMKEQVELSNSLLETAKAKAGKVAAAKDYQSFVASQAEIGQECAQQVLKASQSCAEIITDASKFCQELVEEGVKAANSDLRTTKGKKKAG